MGLTSFLLLISVIICSYISYKLWQWNQLRVKVNKFKGRKCHVLGNLDNLREDRKSHFVRIRNYVNEFLHLGIARAWLVHFPLIIAMCPKEAEIILTNTKCNRKGMNYNPLIPWLGTGLLTSSGRKWQHRRKLLTPAFHFNILQNFLKIFNKESRSLIEVLRLHEEEELNIIPHISKFTLDAVCETAMGTQLHSVDDGSKYYKSIHDIGEISIERLSKPWLLIGAIYIFSKNYWRQRRILKYLHHFSSEVIADRKKMVNTELTEQLGVGEQTALNVKRKLVMLDILLKAQREDGSIDDEGIREEVDTFMFEGHDTTSLSLIYTLMLLANHKIEQNKVYNEIIKILGDKSDDPTYSELQSLKYMDMCIRESLRLYPSVPIISRSPEEDVMSHSGNIIPKNCTTAISIFEIHRRSDFFPNPEVFDPERFLPENVAMRHTFAYIPFSAGPRNCIGQKFAMLEMKCALVHVLKNFILEPVDTPETIKFIVDIVLRPESPIRVKFLPRI